MGYGGRCEQVQEAMRAGEVIANARGMGTEAPCVPQDIDS